MRKRRLTAAAAVAPFLLNLYQAAHAGVTISGATTDYIATSTAASGQPSDVTVASGASVKPSGGSIITVDSNNLAENDGTLETDGFDGAVGILVPGPATSILTNTGTITIGDNYTAPDSANSDGIAEAPFAAGTGRYGIRVLGPFTGGINNSGTITVRGNESYGLSVEGPLIGDILSTGAISLTGDNGFAVRTAGRITGSVQLAAPVSVKGQNSVAVDIAGPIDGRLSFYSQVTATGYAASARPTATTSLDKLQSTPTDLQQGGAALKIESSVGGGVFLGAPPAGTTATSTADADADGVTDGVEGTSLIASYGSAPAIVIGGPAPLTFGVFGPGDNAYGLIIRGTAKADGLFDGAGATAIDIGAGQTGVTIAGGVRVVGSVSANAYQANATAMHLENGALIPMLRNEGAITAVSTTAQASTASGVVIDTGAQLPQLINFGTLSATLTGGLGSVAAVTDQSGSVSLVENTGTISGVIKPATPGAAVAGSSTALDLRANTSGILLRQELNGTISPIIAGDVLLGSGVNTVQLLSGSLTGALDMGSAGGSSIVVAGGATYVGPLSYRGPGLSLNVSYGSFTDTSATPVNLSNLTVGSGATLTLAADPLNAASSRFNVSGVATLAPGSALGLTLLSAPTGEQTFTLIKAGTLVASAGQTAVAITTPYLFSAVGQADPAAGTVTVDLRLRTPAELGLNRSESSAFPAVYTALNNDTQVRTALLGAPTRPTFIRLYDQLLPDHAGDVYQVAAHMSEEVGRAVDETNLTPPGSEAHTMAWLQEINFGMEQAKGDGEAYRVSAAGLAGGFARSGEYQQVGITASGATANINPTDRPSGNQVSVSSLEVGAYWRADFGGLRADVRFGGGYVSMRERRDFFAAVDSVNIARATSARWSGYDLTGRAGLAYGIRIGRIFIMPKFEVEMFDLHEDAYAEAGGGGIDLSVQSRDTNTTRATASVVAGMDLGKAFVWRPEVEVGSMDTLSVGGGQTMARFASGDSFNLSPDALTGSSSIARLRLTGQGDDVRVAFEAGGEFRSDATTGEVRAAVQFPF